MIVLWAQDISGSVEDPPLRAAVAAGGVSFVQAGAGQLPAPVPAIVPAQQADNGEATTGGAQDTAKTPESLMGGCDDA